MPGPQGSKSYKGMSRKGHAILVESSKKVRPWRDSVTWEARKVMESDGYPKFLGPVIVTMTFTWPKPKSAPKTRVSYPATRPDVSKLVRSTEDALTTAGVWHDDGQIVEEHSYKRYPNEGTDALSSPGCVIRIERIA